ncbi:MAG: hypothetical protein CMD03_00135, partial [Flavobacteriales bacterium]|nr:hypothetical protein [Flavobacteriales bacterium]
GCTDSTAFNYNPLALCDDDSCIPFIFGCLDSTAFNYNPLANTDDSSCIAYIYGCLDSLACNYDPMCNFDDGSCLLVFGCTDTTALNFNPLAECDDSSCIASLYGCTDSLACNYNVFANVDDSSCYNLFGCLDSLAYNYDSLANCNDSSLCLYEYNVTFQLDLRGQTTINYTTPEVNGVFNSWCGNCAQMTDLNNDSIWEITIPILEGIGPVIGAPGYEYKFSADNWNIQETLFSGDLCTYTAFGFTNRYLHVTKDTVLDPVCWGSCVDCYAPQSAYNVTFRLDMNNATNFTIPEINGEFNNWCGNCWQMNDIDGDNIWEFTTLVDTSLQEFKFSADNWSIQENLDSTLFCVKTTIDSLGAVFVNRYLHVYSDTVLDIVCWNECDSCNIDIIPSWDCVADGCYDPGTGSGQFSDSLVCILNCNLNNTEYTLLSDQVLIYPNPVNDFVTIESTEDIDKIKVYNVIGEVILEKENPKFLTNFSLSNYSSNIFLIEINSGNQVLHYKILKAK